MPNPLVQTHDRVGVVTRGNLVLVLYAADARLHRTQWIFDRADELIARSKEPILVLLVVAENSGPPDAATRAENARRFKCIDGSLRRIVTVALGDAFKMNIVRAVMRTMLLFLGQSAVHAVTSTVDDGITRLLKEASPSTPTRGQIEADLLALRTELAANPAAPPKAASVKAS
jgi:hypothetical protein